MTLDQLRIFCMVSQCGSFTLAATQLFLTQPAVSAQIKALEDELNVRLFDRTSRQIELTASGRLLRDQAEKILALVQETSKLLRELDSLQRGEVTLAVTSLLSTEWLVERITAFKQKHPRLSLRQRLATPAQVEQMISQGEADLGLLERETDSPLLSKYLVSQDELILIIPPDHPLSRFDWLSIVDLLEYEWVLTEPDSGIRQVIELVFNN